MDDEDVQVFVWTCEVCGKTEESYESDAPPDDAWLVEDATARLGDCGGHLLDPDGNPVDDSPPPPSGPTDDVLEHGDPGAKFD
jgi:hypothetical protein